MTKQQLLDFLTAKYTHFEEDEAKWAILSTYLGYQLLDIPILDSTGDGFYENNIKVWRNGSNYYWKNGEPKATGFLQSLHTFINSKITDATIQFGVIKDANSEIKKATVQVYMPDNSSKILLVTETTPGTFTYKVIA